jgi:hypothetical protein
MNDHSKHQSKSQRSFAVISIIGMAVYFIAWGGFHAYTASTVLFPVLITDFLMRISGRNSAGNGEVALGYFSVLVAAICAGLLFAALYWPIENWLVRNRFPNSVRAGRMMASFLFFLIIWLAFPLKEAL